jgi:hypothetical protein
MKNTGRRLAAGLLFALAGAHVGAQEGGSSTFDPVAAMEEARTLSGDARLACEALLCLASTNRPEECRPSIRRLFSIWRPRDRIRFLRGCPSTGNNQEMDQFARVTADAWPTCTAAWLNVNHVYYQGDDGPYIHDTLPRACGAYNRHAWTMPQVMPRYVGQPQEGGRWVED